MRRGRVLAGVASVLALSPGCASRTEVVIGSKKFTESVILGEIATSKLRGAGVAARHQAQLGGTRILWSALRAGEIDAYPEYTGTLCEEILHTPAACTHDALVTALGAEGVRAGPALGFRDEYALAVRRETAERLGLRAISDLAAHPELRLGFSEEFLARADGWPALRERYGLPQREVRGMDHDLAWRGLASGAVDVMDAYTTDAEIRAVRPRLLEDDKGFFRRYEALFVMRAGLRAEATQALDGLGGTIGDEGMIAMNARARIGKVPEAQVAAEWLAGREGGGAASLSGRAPGEGVGRRLLRRTIEHLVLVAIPLAGAVLLGVPLGILASRRRRLGPAILGATGLLQTVPSLALLVFMIPIFGIGARPALAALLLYSLLPIVRGTASGLEGIPVGLRESAAVIGLSARDRLRLVELPLAMPAILAGVQTAAIIDVGTATLGALIGAGGYGEPILTGIRLDDARLILEGALPAALLALLVQGLFGLLAPRLVSPGLRLHLRGQATAPEA